MSRGSVYGDAEAFLAQLYLQRMASVFGDSASEKGATAQNLNEVVARLDHIIAGGSSHFPSDPARSRWTATTTRQ